MIIQIVNTFTKSKIYRNLISLLRLRHLVLIFKAMAENWTGRSFREIIVPSNSGSRWKDITIITGNGSASVFCIKAK